MNENHYRCPRPIVCKLSPASPLPRPGFCLFTKLNCLASDSAVTLQGLAAVWRSTSAGQVLSRCRVWKTTHCWSLMGSQLPRRLCDCDRHRPHSGSDAAPCRVSAPATGQPGPLTSRVGSLHPESERRVSGRSHGLLMWYHACHGLHAVKEQLLYTCVVHGNRAAE